MTIRSSVLGGLLATASIAAVLGLAAQASPAALPASNAALMGAATAANATGGELLRKAQRALSATLISTKALPADKLAKSAPFLKAISAADKALGAVKAAIAAKDDKALAKAVSGAGKAVGKLNSTFKKAKIDDAAVAESVRAFNASWDRTMKKLGGAKPGTPQQAQENGRRIAALERQIADLKAKRAQDEAEAAELAYLLDLLARAEELNRSPEYQWLALLGLDEAFGYYDGYYDYWLAYDPAIAAYYLDPYNYWYSVYNDYLPVYDTYYAGYDYPAYETPVSVPVTVEINNTIVNNTIIEQADAGIDTIAAAADEAASAAPGHEALETADAAELASPPPEVDDPAATPDEEADKISAEPLDDEAADNAAEQELGEDEPADAPDAEPADEPSDEPAAEPEEATEEPAAEPEEESAEEPAEATEEPAEEAEPDADHDGTPDAEDPDDNNDGTPD